MAKSKAAKALVFRCVSCGHVEVKWLGRCPGCGEWNSLRESTAKGDEGPARAGESFPVPIGAIDASEASRMSTGLGEFDRVLGGGLLRGSAILIGGEPGIGKSTLLLQVAASCAVSGRVLYVSGEESPAQIRMRAGRLDAVREGLEVFASGNLATIRAALDSLRPTVVIVDSIQTLWSDEAGSVPGTANQIKFCAQELVGWAKAHDSSLFLVAHVTKDGLIAGPKAAEHLVDAVLSFEQGAGGIRVLRAAKNRFGSVDEIGLFRMGPKGLSELLDPSGLFLVRRESGLPPGVAVAPVHEGSRVLLVEIQALAVPAKAGFTRVYSDRIEVARVSRIAAVLEKHANMRLSDNDLYVNVAGGMRLTEPGIDLAVAAALWSARTGQALPSGAALAGELSLAGEVRPVVQMRKRARAAANLGFGLVLGPADEYGSPDPGDKGAEKDTSDWKRVSDLGGALKALFGGSGPKALKGEKV